MDWRAAYAVKTHIAKDAIQGIARIKTGVKTESAPERKITAIAMNVIWNAEGVCWLK